MKLNLGCGPIRIPGEIGIDLDRGAPGCDVVADLLRLPLPDGCAAQVRLSHVLEHFPYRLAPTVLLEARRVLAEGGRILVGVPDMVGTCRAWLQAHELGPPRSLAAKAIVARHLYGGQFHDGQEHLAGFDAETLADLLDACGFADVTVREDVERGDIIESLIAEAVKAPAAARSAAPACRLGTGTAATGSPRRRTRSLASSSTSTPSSVNGRPS